MVSFKGLVKTPLCAAALAAVSLSAQAALSARAGGMVYDSAQNITWLADWNYAKTSGFDVDGLMNWNTANAWANNLVYGGFSDWRLPTSLNADGSGPCAGGYNCTGSEMGHMFYIDLGATAGSSILSGSNTANLALFTKVQSDFYWSGTEYAPNPSYAWGLGTNVGYQGHYDKVSALYAVAVRPGDVAAVPEPQTVALMLAGLTGLMVMRRRPR